MCCSTASTKGFLGGSMKAYQTPSNMPLCVHVFMLPHSAPLPHSRVQKHKSVHTHDTYLTLFLTLYHSKIRKIMQKCIDTHMHGTYVHARRHADEGDTPSVKFLSQICALYCDSGSSLLIVAGRNPPSPLS